MVIRFQCPACNQTLQTGPETAGKRVACPCGEKMRVPVPMAAAIDEPTPPNSVGDFFDSNNHGPQHGNEWDDLPSPQNPFGTAPNAANYTKSTNSANAQQHLADAETYHQQREASAREATSRGFFGTETSILNGGTVGGLVAMLVAVLWFSGGLAAGIIFYYPPILFIVGLVAVGKGIFNR